ncbi:MAG: redoxin domain-containing protein [bacterium]
MRIQFVICISCLLLLLPVPGHSQTKANAHLAQDRTDKRAQLEQLKKHLRDNPHGRDRDANDLRIQIIKLLLDVKAPFTEIREVIGIDSKNPDKILFARVATLLADRKEYFDEALELVDIAISAPLIPNDAIHVNFEIIRGYVYLQRREIDKALEIFTRLQKQMPYSETLLAYLGLAYQRAGRIDEAIDAYLQQAALYYYTAPAPAGDDLMALYRQKFGSLDGHQQKIEQTWLVMRRKVFVENTIVNLPGPQWTLNNLAGEPISLGDFKGKILILCFLPFVNAGEDLERLKALQKMYLRYQDRKVAVVCISDERF